MYHTKHRSLIKPVIKEFLKEENLNIFRKNNGVDDDIDLSKQMYSVCFMHQYIILWNELVDHYHFILGCDHHCTMKEWANYTHVSHRTISKIFANSTMNDIINSLLGKDMTVTQLCKKLNISRPAADRFIRILHNELVISISRKDGSGKYYELNKAYFKMAKSAFNDAINKILTNYEYNDNLM